MGTGKEDLKDKHERTLLKKDPNISAVYVGTSHSFLHMKSGDIFGFGINNNLQLGVSGETISPCPTPTLIKEKDVDFISCGRAHTTAFKKNGEVVVWGGSREQSQKVDIRREDIKQVYSNNNFTFFLMKNGEVWQIQSCGTNSPTLKAEKVNLEEKVLMLPSEHQGMIEWSPIAEVHGEFPKEFQEMVETFLLCMHTKIPKYLKLPKPILSIVINFSF